MYQLPFHHCDNAACPRDLTEGRVYLGCGFRGIEFTVERSVARSGRHGTGAEAIHKDGAERVD